MIGSISKISLKITIIGKLIIRRFDLAAVVVIIMKNKCNNKKSYFLFNVQHPSDSTMIGDDTRRSATLTKLFEFLVSPPAADVILDRRHEIKFKL
jgi:hypothetical protein